MSENNQEKNKITNKQITETESLYDILKNFLDNMYEIKHFFDINLPAVKNRETEFSDKFDKFMSAHEKEEKGRKVIIVPLEESRDFEQLLKDKSYFVHRPLLCNSSFLILINNFEYITKSILRKLFMTYPKSIIEKKDFIIEFEDLCQFDNLKEVKIFMINRYLEKIFYKSFSEQNKILLKLFDNKEITSSINFTLLEKATKKRNLLAHNNGVITETFVRQTGHSPDSIGKKLFISKKEFELVYQEILFFGLCFLVLLGKKIKDDEFLDRNYQHLLFSLLGRKEYTLLKRFYETTGSYAISKDGISEVVNHINYLLALKEIPDEKERFNTLLKKYKTQQLSDHFKCAFAIIKDDKKNFLKFLKNSEFTLADWYDFPIFNVFKEDEKLVKKALPILEKNTKRLAKNDKK